MRDYSFIRLKKSFAEAKNIGDSPVSDVRYYDFIQLSPNKTYFQLTNVEGGISFNGDYLVEIIDCDGNTLKNITENVFIEETFNDNGTQLAIEIVNIGEDFYKQDVYFKFSHTVSNLVFYSNPLTITDYQSEYTSYFKYKNYEDFEGIPYSASQKWQSISLRTYFDVPEDESEIEDYYQISRQNTISARALIKRFERYNIEAINRFGYDRLNLVLKHDLIYINNVRVTNKVNLESNERFGNSNIFDSTFTISKDYNDVSEYELQIYVGFEALEYTPYGYITSGSVINNIEVTYNKEIELGNVGVISIYKVGTGLVQELDISLFEAQSDALVLINPISLPSADGEYYFNMTEGFVKALGIENEAITDNSTWFYKVQPSEYDETEYSNEYFI